MERYEIQAILDNRWRKDREAWERTRMEAYYTAQTQSTKSLDPKKIMPFPWDRVNKVEPEDTPEERDEVYREMKRMEEMMNKKHNSL